MLPKRFFIDLYDVYGFYLSQQSILTWEFSTHYWTERGSWGAPCGVVGVGMFVVVVSVVVVATHPRPTLDPMGPMGPNFLFLITKKSIFDKKNLIYILRNHFWWKLAGKNLSTTHVLDEFLPKNKNR